MSRDNAAVPNIGKIIKINPKIMDNIPDILFGSMFFFLQILLFSAFSTEKYKNSKSITLFSYLIFLFYTI